MYSNNNQRYNNNQNSGLYNKDSSNAFDSVYNKYFKKSDDNNNNRKYEADSAPDHSNDAAAKSMIDIGLSSRKRGVSQPTSHNNYSNGASSYKKQKQNAPWNNANRNNYSQNNHQQMYPSQVNGNMQNNSLTPGNNVNLMNQLPQMNMNNMPSGAMNTMSYGNNASSNLAQANPMTQHNASLSNNASNTDNTTKSQEVMNDVYTNLHNQLASNPDMPESMKQMMMDTMRKSMIDSMSKNGTPTNVQSSGDVTTDQQKLGQSSNQFNPHQHFSQNGGMNDSQNNKNQQVNNTSNNFNGSQKLNNMNLNGMTQNSMAPFMNISPMSMPHNGMMQNGTMQNGMMQNGMTQNGMAQNGMMQNGMSQNGMMQNGMSQNGMMQNGMAQNGMAQNSMAQNGMMQNGMSQNGMMQNGMPQFMNMSPMAMMQNGMMPPGPYGMSPIMNGFNPYSMPPPPPSSSVPCPPPNSLKHLASSNGHPQTNTSSNFNKNNKENQGKQSFPFYCKMCDRGCFSNFKYNQHCSEHVKQHRNGMAEKIWNTSESKEDIEKWKKERKMNYPTPANIALKAKLKAERISRGDIIETETVALVVTRKFNSSLFNL